MDAFIGKELSLVTKMNIRYQGVLTVIDFETHALTLVNGELLVSRASSTLPPHLRRCKRSLPQGKWQLAAV